MLGRRTAAGLLSEDITFDGHELWGNYPQTYSLVGLINCANMLSKPWASVSVNPFASVGALATQSPHRRVS
jgi:hypothetical protein